MKNEIGRLNGQSKLKRFLTFLKGESEVTGFKATLNKAFDLFHLQATIAACEDMASILEDTKALIARTVEFNKTLDRVEGSVVKAREDIAVVDSHVREGSDENILSLLPYAGGASWSPSRACHPRTRQTILKEIADFVSPDAQPSDKHIFLLTGVTGSGKTAIAHSVAALCAGQDPSTLITSFMFAREVNGRNTPDNLFSTIARDMSNAIPSVASAVTKAMIKDDNSLLTAPLDRQFEHLILQPSRSTPLNRIMVIVIDALDEGYSEDLLSILSGGFADLPSNFRVVITSRRHLEINNSLFSCKHVLVREIQLDDRENRQDIDVVARDRLREIGERRSLGESWPAPAQLELFIRKAEGLFIWVTTVCNHVAKSVNPRKQLNTLLSNSQLHNASSTTKMDELYAIILDACPWNDEDFSSNYRQLMGAIIALETPLPVGALHGLLSDPDVQTIAAVLEHLGTVLTGLPNGPVRVLHQSFPEYIAGRAKEAKLLRDQHELDFAIDKPSMMPYWPFSA